MITRFKISAFSIFLLTLVFFSCDDSSSDSSNNNENQTYTVTFDSQKAKVLSIPTSKTVVTPETVIDELPVPPVKTGDTFAGWYTEKNGGGTEFIEDTVVTSDITVYAKWIYAIGGLGGSGVGIVFYITDGGLHGLEAAPSRWSGSLTDPQVEWSTITNQLADGVSPLLADIGSGSNNTTVIINQNSNASSAAKLCRLYTGGSLSDWYLPSKNELEIMTQKRLTIGGFSDSYYWSSTESSNTQSYVWNFNPNYSYATGKGDWGRVRPIRSF